MLSTHNQKLITSSCSARLSPVFLHLGTQTSMWTCHPGATASEDVSSFIWAWMSEAHHGRVFRRNSSGLRAGRYVKQTPSSGCTQQHPLSFRSGTIFRWATVKPGNLFSKENQNLLLRKGEMSSHVKGNPIIKDKFFSLKSQESAS